VTDPAVLGRQGECPVDAPIEDKDPGQGSDKYSRCQDNVPFYTMCFQFSPFHYNEWHYFFALCGQLALPLGSSKKNLNLQIQQKYAV